MQHTTKPIWFNTYVRILTFKMIWRTRSISWTINVILISCIRILTIVYTITQLSFWNAFMVGTSKFTIGTRRILTIVLITMIIWSAIIFMITSPCFEDTSSIAASKFVRTTCMNGTKLFILIRTVCTIFIACLKQIIINSKTYK